MAKIGKWPVQITYLKIEIWSFCKKWREHYCLDGSKLCIAKMWLRNLDLYYWIKFVHVRPCYCIGRFRVLLGNNEIKFVSWARQAFRILWSDPTIYIICSCCIVVMWLSQHRHFLELVTIIDNYKGSIELIFFRKIERVSDLFSEKSFRASDCFWKTVLMPLVWGHLDK